MTVPLECQDDRFSLPADRHYLNCAYISPLPRAAEEAGIAGIRRKRVPTTIGPRDFFEDAERVRRLFAELVNAEAPERIAILPAASYGIAVAARNLPVSAGQNLVMTHEQFPGNVYAWRRVAREAGAEIRTVRPPEGAGRGMGWNERILEAIDRDTAVVTLGHVHWTDGTLFDLEAIGTRAREVGAALVVDGTQSVGALPFDVERIRPDALVCAAYKWLLGPYSLGLAYFGPRFDDGVPLEETWIAREGSEDFSGLVEYVDAYQPGAVRYDVGERSNFILLPMLLASLRLLLEWRPERTQEYCRRIVGPLIEEARALGFDIEDEAWRAAHLFGLRVPPGTDPGALRDALEERRVAVSLRGSAVRVSPNVYNDPRDIEALRRVLRTVTAAK
ncbi:MAG: aminotransferase class V-fold PLP-dependent enzyme [Gemmatimonadetes bacterium]|nr:aminotransferase class V-fold PLP-dependent enzyme [Gemmatimonadota bacterium]NIR81468.1 aminotransferase class V-fold PLP-dependent enzyme [Gemmatimonadota bacterium]NIT90313.1 aminotransferase class V-fold PLP-dependent enzyme [Gemmatimonadota bacterium]NIU34133.1 aminotransferase class V-fold PLP-dependent enzyme [Gemmatimonadota bacterium]NIU38289.1 aminotransferase class V-fold PLP-dependent enzyme [Gemmatimonadota bacterium]